MRQKLWISWLFILIAGNVTAQPAGPGGQPDKKAIRIVDTLTPQEKSSRNPVLLKAELDSLIKQYNISQVQPQIKEPVKATGSDYMIYIPAAFLIVLLLLGWLVYLFYSHQEKFNETISDLKRQLEYRELYTDPVTIGSSAIKGFSEMARGKNTKNKTTTPALEKKINDLNDQLNKLTKENESLAKEIKEYNGIQHEYELLKQGITNAYKIKNYPGYENNKPEAAILQGVLETENYVAHYAYEKFMKPIFAITDINKNKPARIGEEDREKLLELLISLSLLYMEYLYLRVNDLSIGGKMVERINGLKNGNGLDPSLLKQLNTEHGSRALVIRMVLDKAYLQSLSYPVFDETNLNNQ